ncbi:acetate--CoA ligase family protein [Sulfitobacter aestuarii]|uniref:Acetate--CoA ligase family protein n=1 Tax=Sulfitobacter aestuarii TaxID=2161676 RepID=A0ABW5TZB7_9RHOB
MQRDLSRLLRPRSIAVIGGGAWCTQIIRQSRRMGFSGSIHLVHPKGIEVDGVTAVTSLADLPEVPDAVFIGVNRFASVEIVSILAQMGAGGAVCFASGFAEAAAEDAEGQDLQARLVRAAGAMPVLGPNCYGFINALDGALLWPDQHGCTGVECGVAILTQSSNIAINLSMQQRSLPIAYVVTCGNMAQTGQAEIARALLDDPRVTAIGLHVEGFSDTGTWHALALKAAARNVPLIALKVGASDQAQQATVSHTASLAGSDAGAAALLARLGIARVADLSVFLETLKLLHCNGRLSSSSLSSVSCSGGEASLAADSAHGRAIDFPPLTETQRSALAEALGPMVALSNPLDYHTYIWRDAEKMARAWEPMAAAHIGLTLLIVDYPHTDASDWECATQAALTVRARSGRPVAVVATLPELMPPEVAARLMAGGVTPLCGLSEAIAAAEAASSAGLPDPEPPLLPGASGGAEMISEGEAKCALQIFGLDIPRARQAASASDAAIAARDLRPPLVLKGMGFAHKSEAGAVRLGLKADEIASAARQMQAADYLVEEMVQDGMAELLIGVTRDPAHGFVLTLGAGGVLTELWCDTVSLLLPVRPEDIERALDRLRIAPLLHGYRGKPGVDRAAICSAVLAVQAYVIAHQDSISEVEINPLICTPVRAVAADALIRKA